MRRKAGEFNLPSGFSMLRIESIWNHAFGKIEAYTTSILLHKGCFSRVYASGIWMEEQSEFACNELTNT